MMSNLSRRQWLQLMTASGLACGLPKQSRATDGVHEGPLLAVFNATGGWDTTYIMDPKGTVELNRGYQEDQIQSVGAISFAPTASLIASGAMSNEVFFNRYGSECLVINGVDVSVNNHSPCSRYMATGELGSLDYPTLPALYAASVAPEVPLSFLTFGDYSATGGLIAQTRIPYLRSLSSLASGGYTDWTRSRRYHHESVDEHIQQTLRMALNQNELLPSVSKSRSMIISAQEASLSLDRVIPYLDQDAPSDLFSQQIEIALAGFASGLTAAANLKLGTFDSHDTNDPDQLELIPQLLAGVDHMLIRAEQLGIRDRLTIVIQSEMGRTPWYNSTGGKDHWSVTSMMMIGPDINGGRVVGGTTINPESGFDQHPEKVDPTSLMLSSDGIRVRPEHVQWALRKHLGIAEHPFAQRFPLNLNEQEQLESLLTGGA